MTSTTDRLSRASVARLRTCVVSTDDGYLATTSGDPEPFPEDFATTSDHVRQLVFDHFATYVDALPAGIPPRIMLHAHGGLVSATSALAYADVTADFWRAHHVFPVYFVWRSGKGKTFFDVLDETLSGGDDGTRSAPTDDIVELLCRFGQGRRFWREMKEDARRCSRPEGGALAFAEVLQEYLADRATSEEALAPADRHPPVELHAVGHSAGSIFHSAFVPAARRVGLPAFTSLALLAPAIRIDEFRSTLAKAVKRRDILSLTLFTMRDAVESEDDCGPYRKSLLYLIHGALENTRHVPLLGLQKCVDADPDMSAFFSTDPRIAEAVYAHTEATAGRSASHGEHHGDFDDDLATMNSVARRILRLRDDQALARDFPSDDAHSAKAPRAGRDAGPIVPVPVPEHHRMRALCIGISAYAGHDALNSGVKDAERWAAVLAGLGFAPTILRDKEASKEGIMLAILDLVLTARPGDVIVIHYSGHGVAVPDLDGDERFRHGRRRMDSALCPIGFRDGTVIVDDELALIWEQLREGVNATLFFDSCYAGDAARNAGGGARAALDGGAVTAGALRTADDPGRNMRTVELSAAESAAAGSDYRQAGPIEAPSPQPVVLYSACSPTQVAYEGAEAGDFTALVVPLVEDAYRQRLTNREFLDRIIVAFGTNPGQDPMMTPALEFDERPFLRPVVPVPSSGQTGIDARPAASERLAAAADLLRAAARLLES
ncbi:caspase family protein [Rathayibacter sp. VKM Ac-2857]|uniref:caspase family protein n=1 Tax=Rathayibacter sp. VKM Ac-2857 TaxID=2739020 RepID=UPI001564AD59|nr:caspase family protein [Rathayibacter sp. VKM Ac-2857]NQX16722.1 caspase family protein [Rathayibacter sp. VKM Ac-2857]